MSSCSLRALRLIVIAIASGALVLHTVDLWSMIGPSATAPAEVLDFSHLLVILTWGLGFAILAFVVILRVGHRDEAVFAALFLSVYSLWGGFLTLGGSNQQPFQDALWLGFCLVACDALSHAIGIRFTQIFPKALVRSDLVELARGPVTRTITGFLAVLLNPRIYWTVAITYEVSVRLLSFTELPGFPVFGLHVIVWIVIAITYMYASFRCGGADERRRIFWILEGVVLILAMEILGLALWAANTTDLIDVDLGFWLSVNQAISASLSLSCFAMAIFNAGAFDVSLILRRTTVVTLTSTVVLIAFISVETAVEEVVEEFLGLESRIGGFIAGFIAALAFRPLSVRIERWMQVNLKGDESVGSSQ